MSAPRPSPRTRPAPPVDPRIRARRRQVVEERRRRQRRVAGSVAGLVLLAGGAYGLSRTPLFLVEDVRVRGVSAARAVQVREAAAIDRGTNLLDVDVAAVRRRVEKLPWVKDAGVRRLPTAVELSVVPRRPAAVVRARRAAWVVDGEGWVLSGGNLSTLVRIDAPDAVVPGAGERIVDRGVRNALAVHTALPVPLRALVDRYDAPSERGLRLRLRAAATAGGSAEAEHVWVRFGAAQRVAAKARVTLLLLDQARRRAEGDGMHVPEGALPPGIGELDVRAPDNPVIVPADRAAAGRRPDEGTGAVA